MVVGGGGGVVVVRREREREMARTGNRESGPSLTLLNIDIDNYIYLPYSIVLYYTILYYTILYYIIYIK